MIKKQIPVLILMGPPGSGKGTQGVRIAEELSIPKISTGDLLRDEIKSSTPTGKKLAKIINQGMFVDDNIVLELLENKISDRLCDDGFILDGFPRNIAQAELLKELLNTLKRAFRIVVIDIAVSDQEVLDRITNRYYCTKCKTNYNRLYKNPVHKDTCDECGAKNSFAVRDDDTKEVVQRRLNEYHKKTSPLITYYENQDILYTVQGDKDIEEVMSQIESILKKILTC